VYTYLNIYSHLLGPALPCSNTPITIFICKYIYWNHNNEKKNWQTMKYIKEKLNKMKLKLITISDYPISDFMVICVPCVVLIQSDQMRVMTPLGLWFVRSDSNHREPLCGTMFMRINSSQSDNGGKATPEVPWRTQGFPQVMSECNAPTALNRAVMVKQKLLTIV